MLDVNGVEEKGKKEKGKQEKRGNMARKSNLKIGGRNRILNSQMRRTERKTRSGDDREIKDGKGIKTYVM